MLELDIKTVYDWCNKGKIDYKILALDGRYVIDIDLARKYKAAQQHIEKYRWRTQNAINAPTSITNKRPAEERGNAEPPRKVPRGVGRPRKLQWRSAVPPMLIDPF